MGRFNKFITLILVLVLLSCYSELEKYNQSNNSYLMPDVDIFIVRGPESSGVVGSERFQVSSGEDAAAFVARSFLASDENSINHFLKQLEVTFYHSRIRVFYIRVDPADIGLVTMHNQTSFMLTDDSGIVDKGLVYNESGPLKIYLVGDETPSVSYSGLGYVNALGCLVLSKGGVPNNLWLSIVVAHELGHNFGLWHPFDSSDNPNPLSCSGASKGTTNRVMDYTTNPEVFSACERFISSVFLNQLYISKRAVQSDRIGNNLELYTGGWTGSRVIGSMENVAHYYESASIEVD